MKLILLGAPGAGKGTQAEKISTKYGIPSVSTGEILRAAIKDNTALGMEAKSFMDRGDLVPDAVVIGIIKEYLSSDNCKNGFILDGFPRSIPQAEALDAMGVTIDAVLDIEVDDAKIVERMSGRRVCLTCGATHHVVYNPPKKEGICDKCGAELTIRKDDEPETDEGTAVFAEGDTVPVSGFGLAQKKTVPRPLYTEATLLAAMETCGREIADEQAREAVKELGIGTPATRAAIITTLFKRDYIARSGKSIVPTEKGLHIYEAVKDMLVADVSLTGSWEKTLLQIERHTLGPDTFMASITDYTRKATREILNLSLPAAAARTFTCPKCKTGHIIVREKSARCDNKGCGLTVYRRFLNKELTDQHLEQLFSSGSTRLIKGFKGKKGVAFDASVTFDAGFTLTLSFPKNGNGRKRK